MTTPVIRNVQSVTLGSRSPKPTALDRNQMEALLTVWADQQLGDEAGVWEAEPGTFSAHRADYHEICLVLSGSAVLTEDGQPPIQVSAGDLFVTPAGWRGTWTVQETLRKVFVLTMDDRAPTYSRTKKTPIQEIRASLNTAVSTPFWLDQPQRPPVTPALLEDTTADLLVVGGGYCGLWTALIAKERNPQLDVVLIEGNEIGWAASGRNGGFCESSLTHGEDNGRRHFTEDLPTLSRLAAQNFQDFQDTLVRYDIDAEYENTGLLTVATEEYQVAALKGASQEGGSSTRTFYDSRSIQTMMIWLVFGAGMFESDGIALVHPAKLVWGLKRACQQLGVRIFESTPAVKLRGESQCVTVETSTALIRSRKVALATTGFPSLLKRARFLTIPVCDYVLATRPLTRAQLDDIGWASRFGITDSSRQSHYYRLTSANRIIWGGYDAS